MWMEEWIGFKFVQNKKIYSNKRIILLYFRPFSLLCAKILKSYFKMIHFEHILLRLSEFAQGVWEP